MLFGPSEVLFCVRLLARAFPGHDGSGRHIAQLDSSVLESDFERLSPTRPIRDKTGLAGRYDFALQEIDEPSNDDLERVNNYRIDHLGL